MDLIQPVIAVLFVLALLGTTLFVLRGRGAVSFRNGSFLSALKTLEVVERISLGPQHALHLVRMGNRTVLIATSPHSCQMLDAPEVKTAGPQP